LRHEWHVARASETREAVFKAYGGYVCVGCGETDKDVLTIDHVNNDGAAHRREIGAGWPIYPWLVSNNFPPGFQVLCANCQMRKLRKMIADAWPDWTKPAAHKELHEINDFL
jgi:hypothetical protein